MNHLGILLKFNGFGVEIEFLHFLTGFLGVLMLLVNAPHCEEHACVDSVHCFKDEIPITLM